MEKKIFKVADRVKILKPGYYKGQTGIVSEVIPLAEADRRIYEITLDCDFLYDPTEYILVKDTELTSLT